MTTARQLRDRLLEVTPPHAPRVVEVPIPHGEIHVATGERGEGVFLVVLSVRGRRQISVSIGEDAALRLARILTQAAEASALNRATRGPAS